MTEKRIIARIDVKNEYAIKGIQLEGLRKVGDPGELARQYYADGADEIIFMDAVAAYYDRNSLSELIYSATDKVFIPITVGGGIRSLDDIQTALNSGADKVAVNTQAIRDIRFIRESSRVFGSQCIVASVDAKQLGNSWHAYYDNGREDSGFEVKAWCSRLQDAGAGEILLTSIDRDGTRDGFDDALLDSVCSDLSVPVIVSGGAGSLDHVTHLFDRKDIDAVALGSILHYKHHNVSEIKSALFKATGDRV